jgi:hypothetical protein
VFAPAHAGVGGEEDLEFAPPFPAPLGGGSGEGVDDVVRWDLGFGDGVVVVVGVEVVAEVVDVVDVVDVDGPPGGAAGLAGPVGSDAEARTPQANSNTSRSRDRPSTGSTTANTTINCADDGVRTGWGKTGGRTRRPADDGR